LTEELILLVQILLSSRGFVVWFALALCDYWFAHFLDHMDKKNPLEAPTLLFTFTPVPHLSISRATDHLSTYKICEHRRPFEIPIDSDIMGVSHANIMRHWDWGKVKYRK
jgi:hypothetical protein